MLIFRTVSVVLCLKFLFITGHSCATDKVDVEEPAVLTPLLKKFPKAIDGLDLSPLRVIRQASSSVPEDSLAPSSRLRKIVSWVRPSTVFSAFTEDDGGKTSSGSEIILEEPLILTPLLESGRVTEAQRKSRVSPDIGNTTSYSGYFTVNKACDSNIFFWFFPAQQNQAKAPVVLFLQGGPGVASIHSLFEENGPFTYKETLRQRLYSWNIKNNLIYIDQPVGTGYSFTGKGCYAENETVVGEELYSAMVQFYQLFPELRRNKFFITGYSYAGHFIPAFGYTIHKKNPKAQVKINLSGMMIGNGWMDAVYQNDLGSYLYQLGLVDTTGRDVYYDYQRRFLEHMRNKEYEQALRLQGAVISTVYTKYVGYVSFFNYLQDNPKYPTSYKNFLQSPAIRNAIHVGNTSFAYKTYIVEQKLGVDPVLSVKPWIETLLEHYPIVLYTGHLDIVSSYAGIVNLENNLHWSGEEHFKNATRQKWCLNGAQVGYLKGDRNLYDVMVRNAAHAVTFDQPESAYFLVNSFTSGPKNNPFHALDKC